MRQNRLQRSSVSVKTVLISYINKEGSCRIYDFFNHPWCDSFPFIHTCWPGITYFRSWYNCNLPVMLLPFSVIHQQKILFSHFQFHTKILQKYQTTLTISPLNNLFCILQFGFSVQFYNITLNFSYNLYPLLFSIIYNNSISIWHIFSSTDSPNI